MDTKYCEAFELNSTEHKHVRIATIEIGLTWRPVPKQIGILLYVSLIIMVEIVMYTSFYTMLEDGYKILWSFWIKQHWTQACSYLADEDLFQSKSASFSRMFR